MFENTHENLTAWLTNPQAQKPGTLMKIPQLTPEEVQALTAYLESLR
jgi:cytochrome c1